MLFKLGRLSNSTWHVPETEASRENLSRVVDCFTGEIHNSRETGPPEQPQREVRRPPAQSRPSAAPRKMTRPSQTQFFISLCLANHASTDQVTTSLSCSTAVSPSLLLAWGFGAAPVAAACVGLRGCASHPRHHKSDSLFGGAGRNYRLLTAAPRGGRGPLLASSLVDLWCSLTLVRYSISKKMRCSSIGLKGIFFTKLYSNQTIFFVFLFDYYEKGLSLRRALIIYFHEIIFKSNHFFCFPIRLL